jgi:hypothetical protein
MLYARNILSMLILIITLTGCGGSGGDGTHSGAIHSVQYQVSTYSTSPVSITYISEEGNTIDLPSVNITDKSWTYSFSAQSGAHLYLSATLLSGSDDIFYATITVDSLQVNTTSQKGTGGQAVLEFTIPAE